MFHDRAEAGQRLTTLLGEYKQRDDVLVLGLARGGIPVAYEVARALAAPLDVVVVRKLGVPYDQELAMGAIASGGVRVVNEELVRLLGISPAALAAVTTREQRELSRREQLYRGERPPFDAHGRTVILVDDGIATGATMRAAIAAVRRQQPERIVVAIPIAAASTCKELRREADEVVCAVVPQELLAIGLWYESFAQISDATLRSSLTKAWHAEGAAERTTRGEGTHHAQPIEPVRWSGGSGASRAWAASGPPEGSRSPHPR